MYEFYLILKMGLRRARPRFLRRSANWYNRRWARNRTRGYSGVLYQGVPLSSFETRRDFEANVPSRASVSDFQGPPEGHLGRQVLSYNNVMMNTAARRIQRMVIRRALRRRWSRRWRMYGKMPKM